MKIMLRSSPAHHAAATHHHHPVLNGHHVTGTGSNHSSPASSSPILHHHHHHNGASTGLDSPSSTPTHTPTPTNSGQSSPRLSILDSCHRRIRLIGGGPVAFFGGLVAKARRKEREGGSETGAAGQGGDPKLYLEATVLERKLPDADLRLLVDLPPGLDYNEWLASHTMALFDHVNLVYGTVSEFCTMSGCPDMTGPGQRTYLWFDEKGKKTRVAAPQYIDYVMTFIQKTVSDESIFPTKYANEFPVSFESIVRKIIRLLFHVVAHLYAAHFREVVLLGLHAHLNLTFAHLTALQHRFALIEPKETEVLRDLELALRLSEDCNNSNNSTTNNVTANNTPTNSSSNGGGCQPNEQSNTTLLPPSTELATEATVSMELETSMNNSSNSSNQQLSQPIITQAPESIINIAPRISNSGDQPELTHA